LAARETQATARSLKSHGFGCCDDQTLIKYSVGSQTKKEIVKKESIKITFGY
jgi:hypothetical protein